MERYIGDIDLKRVLIKILILNEESKKIYIDSQVENLAYQLKKSTLFQDEIVLLRLLENSVNQKISQINSRITFLENKQRENRFDLNSSTYKGLNPTRIIDFVNKNKDREWSKYDSKETTLAEMYLKANPIK